MDVVDKTCTVCRESIVVFSIGSCDHQICLKCATRMRVLCDLKYCAICRTDLKEVVLTKKLRSFSSVNLGCLVNNSQYGMYFDGVDVRNNFDELLEHSCPFCPSRRPEKNFNDLNRHVRREHERFYCDLCVSHLKIFTSERKCYDRKMLAVHKRMGDPDDSSYRGHPMCEFCSERFLDKDELGKHLYKEHFHCHFCDDNFFYSTYRELQHHFGSKHFLCDEGECEFARFTNAFASEVDLRVHRAAHHSKSQKKSHIRQELALDVDIQLPPRAFVRDGGRGSRGGRPGGRFSGQGRRTQNQPIEKVTHREVNDNSIESLPDTDDMDHFPTLSSEQPSVSQSSAMSMSSAASLNDAKYTKMASATNGVKGHKSHENFGVIDDDDLHKFTNKQPNQISNKSTENLAKASNISSNIKWAKPRLVAENFPSLPTNPSATNIQQASWMTKSHGSESDGKISNVESCRRPNIHRTSIPKSYTAVSADFPNLPSNKKQEKQIKLSSQTNAKYNELAFKMHKECKQVVQELKNNSSRKSKTAMKFKQDTVINKEKATKEKNKLPKRGSSEAKQLPSDKQPKKNDVNKVHVKEKKKPDDKSSDMVDVTKEENDKITVTESMNQVLQKLGAKGNWNSKSKKEGINNMLVYSTEDHTHEKSKKVTVVPYGSDIEMDKRGNSNSFCDVNGNDSTTVVAPDLSNDDDFPLLPPTEIIVPDRPFVDKEVSEFKKDFYSFTETSDSRESPEPLDVMPSFMSLTDNCDFPALPSFSSDSVNDNTWTVKTNVDAKFTFQEEKKKDFGVNNKTKSKSQSVCMNIIKSSGSGDLTDSRTLPEELADLSLTDNASKDNHTYMKNKIELSNENKKIVSKSGPPGFTQLDTQSTIETSSTANAIMSKLMSDLPQNNAPPGFNQKARKPPPGFTNFSNGFASSVIDDTYVYTSPQNFEGRNKQLIADIRRILNNDHNKFNEFKSLSSLYRQSEATATEYYNLCYELFSGDLFNIIFPELLVLLPDIFKQHELQKAYTEIYRSNKKTSFADPFITCVKCQQILIHRDFPIHMAFHNTESTSP